MDGEDARHQKLEQLHERRKQVVRRPVRGAAVMKIVALTGLRYPTVRKTIELFSYCGSPAIKASARARNAGDRRRLSTDQEAAVRRTICDRRPERLKMEFALRTGAAVMQGVHRGNRILEEPWVRPAHRRHARWPRLNPQRALWFIRLGVPMGSTRIESSTWRFRHECQNERGRVKMRHARA